MTEVTKNELRALKPIVEQAVREELGDRYEVSITKSRYGAVGSVTIELAKKDSEGNAQSMDELNFRRNAVADGLEEDDFGATFMSGGSRFEIVGYKPNNHKYPIIGKKIGTELEYKFAPSRLIQAKHFGGEWWRPREYALRENWPE